MWEYKMLDTVWVKMFAASGVIRGARLIHALPEDRREFLVRVEDAEHGSIDAWISQDGLMRYHGEPHRSNAEYTLFERLSGLAKRLGCEPTWDEDRYSITRAIANVESIARALGAPAGSSATAPTGRSFRLGLSR